MQRRIAIAVTIVVGLVAILVVAAPSASASTYCKQYSSYPDPDWANFPTAGKLCMAPSDDYPNYKGPIGVQAAICGNPNYFPSDNGGASTGGVNCLAMITHFQGYKWTNNRWVAYTELGAPDADKRYYVWPFATGWRWVWSPATDWFAVRSTQVSLLWFVKDPVVARGGDTTVGTGPWIDLVFV
jgi:hypothetical protein